MRIDASVQAAAVTGAFTLTVTVVGILAELLRRQGKAIGEVRDHASATREEVQNSHPTNLRDDVDSVLAGLDRVLDGQARHSEALHQHGAEIGGLRAELLHERDERLSVEKRLDHHLTQHNQ